MAEHAGLADSHGRLLLATMDENFHRLLFCGLLVFLSLYLFPHVEDTARPLYSKQQADTPTTGLIGLIVQGWPEGGC